VDNVEMNLRAIRWGVMDWIDLAKNRDHWRAILNTLMILQNNGIFLSSCRTGGFSRRVEFHGFS
jgi:hypothetical protein